MKEFEPNVITNLRNQDMSKMHDVFLSWVEQTFPDATEKQKTRIMFHAVRIYWMMDDGDKLPSGV